jgi:hypothetical protein
VIRHVLGQSELCVQGWREDGCWACGSTTPSQIIETWIRDTLGITRLETARRNQRGVDVQHTSAEGVPELRETGAHRTLLEPRADSARVT